MVLQTLLHFILLYQIEKTHLSGVKQKQLGIERNHKEACWNEYKRPTNYIGNGVYPDYMWAMLSHI